MNILNKLKLDNWRNLVLYLGIIVGASSLIFKIDFLENKYLFGLSLGMILFSLSFWVAVKKLSTIKPPNVYTGGSALISWEEIHHNLSSMILFILGLGLIVLFGYKVIGSLI